MFFFFFKQKTAYEMRISDWSSDVCSSDLLQRRVGGLAEVDQDAEVGGVTATGGQEVGELLVEVVDVQAVQRASAQVVHRAHRGHHLVPARLGQQRHVVTGAQVLVAAAQVDHVGAFVVGADRRAQGIHRAHHSNGGVIRADRKSVV